MRPPVAALALAVAAFAVLPRQPAQADTGVYETMMKERMLNNVRNSPSWKNIPVPIKERYSACFAASLVAGLTRDEVEQMNVGAQGVRLSEDLAQKALDQLMVILDKLNNHDLSVLAKACPDDIADFHKAGL